MGNRIGECRSDLFADRTFIPSTEDFPKCANPIPRAARTTSANSPLNPSKCRRRNPQSVRRPGSLPVADTRNTRSSSGLPAIPRDGNTPVVHPYGSTPTIIRGP